MHRATTGSSPQANTSVGRQRSAPPPVGHSRQAHAGSGAAAAPGPVHAKRTLCGMPLTDLREYPVAFSDQDASLSCPMCDEATG
jgi:hypothetical protein